MNVRSPGLRPLLAFAFASGVGEGAIVTTLPSLRNQLGLSGLQAGLVLSASTMAMLVTAIPISSLAGRIGSRRLLAAGAVLVPVSLALVALAPSLGLLLLARFVFGTSASALWVLGPPRAVAGGRGATGTGSLIATSGVGWLAGPLIAGVLTDVVGWRFAFAVLAVLVAPIAFAFVRDRASEVSAAPLPFREVLAAAGRDREAVGATLVSALLGTVTGVIGLLAPFVLSRNGVSAGGIGVVFALGSAMLIVTAALISRTGSRFVSGRLVGVAVVALGVVWLVPALSPSTLAMAALVIVSGVMRATINTLVYAVAGRSRPAAGATAVMGVMSLAWSVTALAAPLIAASVSTTEGARMLFTATAVLACVLGAWLTVRSRPVPVTVG